MNKQKILIIDDDEDILNFFFTFLPKDKFEVVTAISAKEGFKKLERFTPDLILLDIKMPVLDGWESNRQLKSDVRYSNIPVAFLTAKEELSDKLTAMKEGVVDYIMKTINQNEIIQRITNILNK